MSPSTGTATAPDEDRDDFPHHLSRGVDAVAEAPFLVLVPLVSTLLGFGRLDDLLASTQVISFTLGLPSPVPDLWAFLNATPAVGVTGGAVGTVGAPEIATLLVGTLVRAVLGAGLLGVLAGIIADGEPPAFTTAVSRHFVPVLAYEVLVVLGVLLLALVTLASGGSAAVVLVGILLALPVLYAIYGTPFVAVARNCGFGDALSRSVSLAGSAPYALFTLGYAVLVLVCSPVVSGLAYAVGISGVLLAALVAAPIGTVLAATATSFFLTTTE
ncbi:hypothetical protein [Halorarum halobium]|uniref:hypothetical protein n=1 Tax=Halorarum halobium TaxID=3075121 RepID=UPI0028B05360|nr:hypothetical protein [Halobaculum sp. XH14]